MRATLRLLAPALLLLLLTPFLRAQEKLPYPENYTEKLGSMPDFHQRAERLLDSGESHCGPAAAANVIAWLGEHGCPGLLPEKSERPLESVLIEDLGVFMATRKGTSPLALMAGFEEYCAALTYDAILEFRGWRQGGKYKGATRPELPWIFEGVQGASNVLLQLGFYRYDPESDRYERTSGHWVTMVGYEGAEQLEPRLFIHDPYKPQGAISCTANRLASGTFSAWRDVPEGPAAGWLKLQGLLPPKGADVVVLDGAVRFRVKKKPILGGTVKRDPENAEAPAP